MEDSDHVYDRLSGRDGFVCDAESFQDTDGMECAWKCPEIAASILFNRLSSNILIESITDKFNMVGQLISDSSRPHVSYMSPHS